MSEAQRLLALVLVSCNQCGILVTPNTLQTELSMRFGLILAAMLLVSGPAASEGVPHADIYVVDLGEKVDGLSLNAYVNEWWQWAFSMRQSESPVSDLTGEYCGVNQRGPVWFLAGGYGTSKINRTCPVPEGRHIFFPVINLIEYTEPGSEKSCDSVRAHVAENNARYVYVKVRLDGSEVTNAERFRLASSECFDPLLRVPEAFNPPSFAPAATDGYWMMVRPLPVGHHTLEFRAFYTNPDEELGDMVQNITYDLMILAQ
ncbi:MAG: hypothetical protein WBB85_13665 [Albidovulum sp.]|uniref:hypothetical protein n=1 Tax=Albidovulum sp. TaxID=1872424 RepID=UPI003C94C4BF